MSDEFDFSTGRPSAEMAQYLQLYVDETTEQLEALVESLLVLETHPTDAEQLNESFRLIHSIKGSSGMMGLGGITALAHHLENHFERLRSGLTQLDARSMALILRCIDFLRECNARLRSGAALGSAEQLLEELNALSTAPGPAPDSAQTPPNPAPGPAPEAHPETPSAAPAPGPGNDHDYRLIVHFERDLPLADLKAELVLTRLSDIGALRGTEPARELLPSVPELRRLQVLLTSDRPPAEVRAAADADGVQLVEIEEGERTFASAGPQIDPVPAAPQAGIGVGAGASLPAVVAEAPTAAEAPAQVAETMRVDIGRLDHLMSLAGELVISKARFAQIARQMSPTFRKSGAFGKARGLADSMRRALHVLKTRSNREGDGPPRDWNEQLREVEAEIDSLEEQSRLWEEGRRSFAQFTDAIDQMSRISDNLQRGVLQTRMVPVAPLFNRFKRVVRDIAGELGKKVQLEICGEKTELDKRMIDELGDPLVHLVRNAIDHGIETAEVRVSRGKPEAGTLRLEAAHSGNHVLISVRDDGGGINVDKVRRRIVERGLVPQSVASGFSEREVIEHIWHPGFSTADAVSDISGRGVGMDIVKTRIADLNGAIDVEHVAGRGTAFTVRLPLTLAIIRSLLFRMRHGTFAVPIANVREIVSAPADQIVTIRGRRTFEVRGEFILLVGIDEIFDWHGVEHRPPGGRVPAEEAADGRLNVVILHSSEQSLGLAVDELLGGQDIVIKSLAENFIHIRGLSGASILGDGSVCLLLDTGAVIAMAAGAARNSHRDRGPCC